MREHQALETVFVLDEDEGTRPDFDSDDEFPEPGPDDPTLQTLAIPDTMPYALDEIPIDFD